jgi:hypothetical protein
MVLTAPPPPATAGVEVRRAETRDEPLAAARIATGAFGGHVAHEDPPSPDKQPYGYTYTAGGPSVTASTRMPRCYELAHIVGISKTPYVLATPRCLEWRHDRQRTSTSNDPSDSDSQDPCRRPARRHRGDRRSPRLPIAGVLVLDGRIIHRRPSQ